MLCIVMKLEGTTENKYPNPLTLEVKHEMLGVAKSFAELRMHLILDYMLLVFFTVPIILGAKAFCMGKYNLPYANPKYDLS